MAMERPSGKLAVILHADVAGSTELVQQDEHLAHERIQGSFRRFGDTISKYNGHVRELRGDALLAEFERASDAVTAALAFQANQFDYNAQPNDRLQPKIGVGIAMGEVVIADATVTGAGVVLAQCVEQDLKGFEQPVRVHAVRLQPEAEIPAPEPLQTNETKRTTFVATAVAAALLVAIALAWF